MSPVMSSPPRTTRVQWGRAVVAIAVATVLNLIVAFAAASASGADDFLALQPGPVATVTIVTMLIGTLLFAVLTRLTSRARVWFTALALSVAVLSLAAPISLAVDPDAFPGATTSGALALIPLHLIPAVALVSALTTGSKGRAS